MLDPRSSQKVLHRFLKNRNLAEAVKQASAILV